MITPEDPKQNLKRSGMFFGLGVRLAVTGSIVVVVYFFLVAQSPLEGLRETLSWVVPVGIVFWILAAGVFAAGLVAWNAEESGGPDFISTAGRMMMAQTAPDAFTSCRALLAGARVAMQKTFPDAFSMEWTLPLLLSLDGQEFRELTASFFREIGFSAVVTRGQGRKGVDIWLYGDGEAHAVGAVRCIPGAPEQVDSGQVREFMRQISEEKVEHGVILTMGVFSEEALALAMGKKVELISGQEFLTKLNALPDHKSKRLLRQAAGGDGAREEVR